MSTNHPPDERPGDDVMVVEGKNGQIALLDTENTKDECFIVAHKSVFVPIRR